MRLPWDARQRRFFLPAGIKNLLAIAYRTSAGSKSRKSLGDFTSTISSTGEINKSQPGNRCTSSNASQAAANNAPIRQQNDMAFCQWNDNVGLPLRLP